MLGSTKKYAGLLVAAMAAAFASSMAAGGRAIGDAALKPTNHRRAQRQSAGRRGYRKHHMTTLHEVNGERECARRRRQIAAGTLQVSK